MFSASVGKMAYLAVNANSYYSYIHRRTQQAKYKNYEIRWEIHKQRSWNDIWDLKTEYSQSIGLCHNLYVYQMLYFWQKYFLHETA